MKGYPTFRYYENGAFVEKYGGGRDESSFVSFIKQKQEAKSDQKDAEQPKKDTPPPPPAGDAWVNEAPDVAHLTGE